MGFGRIFMDYGAFECLEWMCMDFDRFLMMFGTFER